MRWSRGVGGEGRSAALRQKGRARRRQSLQGHVRARRGAHRADARSRWTSMGLVASSATSSAPAGGPASTRGQVRGGCGATGPGLPRSSGGARQRRQRVPLDRSNATSSTSRRARRTRHRHRASGGALSTSALKKKDGPAAWGRRHRRRGRSAPQHGVEPVRVAPAPSDRSPQQRQPWPPVQVSRTAEGPDHSAG